MGRLRTGNRPSGELSRILLQYRRCWGARTRLVQETEHAAPGGGGVSVEVASRPDNP